MPGQQKIFYCLRCQRRFTVNYNAGEVVERSCPSCGSNSVRMETKTAAKQKPRD